MKNQKVINLTNLIKQTSFGFIFRRLDNRRLPTYYKARCGVNSQLDLQLLERFGRWPQMVPQRHVDSRVKRCLPAGIELAACRRSVDWAVRSVSVPDIWWEGILFVRVQRGAAQRYWLESSFFWKWKKYSIREWLQAPSMIHVKFLQNSYKLHALYIH